MKNWKVYIHTTPNGKYYVGITSQSIAKRWGKGSGYKKGQLFTKAIKKYGWDNIQHEVIAENLTEHEAKKFEQTLIEKLKSNNKKYGYNCTVGGDGTIGFRHSDSTKHYISNLNKGRSCNNGSSNGMYGVPAPNRRKVECVNTGQVFGSIKLASLHIGVHPTSLSKPLAEKGYCKSKGYEWRYIDE